MVSIDYDKLNEVSGALKKLYEMVQCNLEGAKLGYSGICITLLEALMCPQIGDFEDDMDELQTKGNKALEDIQELINGIHNVINKFQESESKLEHDVNAATVSSLLLGADVLSPRALMMLGKGSILSNESITSVNTGTKKTDKTKGIDDFILSASTAGAVGATDKVISTASKKGILGKRTYEVVREGTNRAYRRANKLSRTYPEMKSSVRLREGFGAIGAVLAAGIAVEDVKNNDTAGARVGAIAIDGASTALAYGTADIAAGLGTSIATGAVDIVVGIIGVAALPEIAVGAVAVTGAVAGVFAAGWVISSAAGTLKGALNIE